jgi:hypothetical protein
VKCHAIGSTSDLYFIPSAARDLARNWFQGQRITFFSRGAALSAAEGLPQDEVA